MFGGGSKGQSTTEQRYTAIQVQQSAYGGCVPLIYGQTRIPPTLIWYGDFVATAHTSSQKTGGKGGGGGSSSSTTYTYSTALILSLCDGPIPGIQNIWKDKEKTANTAATLTQQYVNNALTSFWYGASTWAVAALSSGLAKLGLTLFTGAGAQSVWSWLTSNHSAQAIGYDHTAYVAASAFDLGSSAALPNLSFEIRGFKSYTSAPASGVTSDVVDAEPSDILSDYCTDANHGCGFNYLSSLNVGAGSWQEYCKAMNLFFSHQEVQQRQASDFIAELLKITNSNCVWSANELVIVPYADEAVAGTITNRDSVGAAVAETITYTPNLTPLFSFTDDDYIYQQGSDPVIMTRTPTNETYNKVRIEYLDSANDYNVAIAEASDANDIAVNGERVMQTLTYHCITSARVARLVAQLILQRQLYIRNSYEFTIRADFSLLEPMDIVSITDIGLELNQQLVRITKTLDNEDDSYTITVEELPIGTHAAPRYSWDAPSGYVANYQLDPGPVVDPLIFNAPPLLATNTGGFELWMAIGGATPLWGGCNVYFSPDNINYQFLGSIHGAARYGYLTSTLPTSAVDPDVTNTLHVKLRDNAQVLLSGTQNDADNMRTLIFVDGEIMAYETATLTAPGAYDLDYLRRGQYGSIKAQHVSGRDFVRLDQAVFKAPFDSSLAGTIIYFKFASFNIWGGGQQDLAGLAVYSHQLNAANLIAPPIDGNPGDIIAIGSDGHVTTRALPSNILVSLSRFQLDNTNGWRAIQFDGRHADWSGSGNGYRFKLDCDIHDPTNAATITVTMGIYVNNTFGTHVDLWQSVLPAMAIGDHWGVEIDLTTIMEPGHLISVYGAGLATDNTDYASTGGTPGKGEFGSQNIVAAPVIRLDQYNAESLVAAYDFETFYIDFASSNPTTTVIKGMQQVEFLAGASTIASVGEITVTITTDYVGTPLNIESLMTSQQLSQWRSGRVNLTIDTDLSGVAGAYYEIDGDSSNYSALTIPIHGHNLIITIWSGHLLLQARGGDGGDGGYSGQDPGPGEDGGHAIHITGTGSATVYLRNEDPVDNTVGSLIPGGPGGCGGWPDGTHTTGGGGGGLGVFNGGLGGLGRNPGGSHAAAADGSYGGGDGISFWFYGQHGGGYGGLSSGVLHGARGGGNGARYNLNVDLYRKAAPPGSPADTVEYVSLAALQTVVASGAGSIEGNVLTMTPLASDFGATRFISFSVPSTHELAQLTLAEFWPVPAEVAGTTSNDSLGDYNNYIYGDLNPGGWTAAKTGDSREQFGTPTIDGQMALQNLLGINDTDPGRSATGISWVPPNVFAVDTFNSQVSLGLVTPAHESTAVCGKAVKRDPGIGGSTTLISGDDYNWVRGDLD